MTTISIPSWFSDLLLYALCTGLLLGLEHEIFWPGKNVANPLPVWATQIMGVATLWIGFTAFFVLTTNILDELDAISRTLHSRDFQPSARVWLASMMECVEGMRRAVMERSRAERVEDTVPQALRRAG